MGQQLAPMADSPAAPLTTLRLAQPLKRIGGGYETDVFRSGDGRLAIKLKHTTGSREVMLARAQRLASVARLFCGYLGPAHSIPSDYLIVADEAGQSHVVAIQTFLDGALALDALDLATLGPAGRTALAEQLEAIIIRAIACYRATGYLPDLYGLGHHDSAQARRWDPRWLAREGWRIVAGSPLIKAHNLLLTAAGRVVLVDYDPICNSRLSCRFAYGARAVLLWRDRRQVTALAHPSP